MLFSFIRAFSWRRYFLPVPYQLTEICNHDTQVRVLLLVTHQLLMALCQLCLSVLQDLRQLFEFRKLVLELLMSL